MRYRRAILDECGFLAVLNHRLIRDEGHRNPMGLAELTSRLRGWLTGEYQAVIFEEVDDLVAYALYKEENDRIHLRQFFVQRDKRRSGRGRRCIGLLRSEVWPSNKRVTVDVLCHNKEGTEFWRAVGFSEYCLTLEILPE